MKKNAGFTLIELMIVVAIIAIIAAVAIPSLLSSKLSANESATIGNLRAVVGAQVAYCAANPAIGYAAAFTDLSGTTPPLLDTSWNAMPKSGYAITLANATVATFECSATPAVAGKSGNRGFFVDESGVIRADASGTATNASTPIS